MAKNLITLVCCCFFLSSMVIAQEADDWHRYQLDELVSVRFPCETPANINWTDSSCGCGDSTFRLWVRVVDLTNEIEEMGRVKNRDVQELVYKTRAERMRRASRHEITRKLWRWQKNNFDMVTWYPYSNVESEFFWRVRPSGWGSNMEILPAFLQYDRVLLYNRKLYVFSMLRVTLEYHDNDYFRRGGRTEDELRTLKEKFFRSIEIKKQPASS